jgi:hypothetical protein
MAADETASVERLVLNGWTGESAPPAAIEE